MAPSSVVISGSRSRERNGRSWRMIAAWISPLSATAVMASSTLDTTRSSNCTSSDGSRSARRLSARLSGTEAGRVVGQQNGVELLPLRPRLKLLVGQRRKHVEQCGAVAILRQQAHRQRHLVGQPLRCQIGEIAAERLQIRRARVQPVPLVGAQTIQQPLRPGDLLPGVQPGPVHDVAGDGTRRRASSRCRSGCTTDWLLLPALKHEAFSGGHYRYA